MVVSGTQPNAISTDDTVQMSPDVFSIAYSDKFPFCFLRGVVRDTYSSLCRSLERASLWKAA